LITRQFRLVERLDINYLMHFSKSREQSR
jgi:hypothetical protein